MSVTYENIGGKGGTIGLAKYVEKYDADPDTLLMSGMVMVGAVALQKPAVDHEPGRARGAPHQRLRGGGGEGRLAHQDHPKDLIARCAPNRPRTVIAGGSAGGVDHMYAGMLARVAGQASEDAGLPGAPGRREVVEALGGKAAAGISGYSEFSDAWPAASCAPSACRPSAVPGHPLGARTGRGRRPGQLARRAHRQEGAAYRKAVLLEAVRRATTHDLWQSRPSSATTGTRTGWRARTSRASSNWTRPWPAR
jgi:putative tricarboxylic transport membrane protein